MNPYHEEQLQVPAAVEQIIVKLLSKQPNDRYQTPAQLAEVLATVQERLARGGLPVPPRPQPETLVELDLTPRHAPILNAVPIAKKPAANGTPRKSPRDPIPETVENVPPVNAPRRRLWPWLLGGAAAIVPIAGILVGLSMLAVWSSMGKRMVPPEAERVDTADVTQWNHLLLKAQKKSAPDALRNDLLAFRTQFPGSPHLHDADAWLSRLHSPFDKLDRVMLPRVPLVTLNSMPELVGVVGEHRGYAKNPTHVVAVSPDGRWLLGAEEPAVRLWDTSDLARPPVRFQPHAKRLHAAAFSPDGKRLATAGDESAIRLWDPGTRAAGLILDKHRAPVTRLTFSRDGTLLASAGTDAKIYLWDPATGADLSSLATGPDEVQTLAFSPDGEALFWGTATHVRWAPIVNGTVNAARPRELAITSPSRVLAFAPDGRTLLCGGGKGIVLVCSWDGRLLAERARFVHEVLINKNKQSLPVGQAVFAPDGKSIATAGDRDHRARVWDAATLTLRHEWDLQCPVVAAVFALDGRHVITGNGNSTLTIFRLASYTASATK